MKVEISWNKIDDWWLAVGISLTKYNYSDRYVLTLEFLVFSVYFRFKIK